MVTYSLNVKLYKYKFIRPINKFKGVILCKIVRIFQQKTDLFVTIVIHT